MKYAVLFAAAMTSLLSSCAVVAVGAAAVSVTTTAVGLTYDATKAVAKGTYAVGEIAVDAMSSPTTSPNPAATTSPSANTVEIHRVSE